MNDVGVIERKIIILCAKHCIAMLLKEKEMKNIGLYIYVCVCVLYIYIYTEKRKKKKKMNLLQSCVGMLLQIVFK